MLRPRTNAEAHLYMDLHPCPRCGRGDFARTSRLLDRDGELVSAFEGACAGCGELRRFEFQVADDLDPRRPAPNWGGPDPSAIICPGEFLHVADELARRVPATLTGLDAPAAERARRDLAYAIAALDEVLKFIPGDVDRVPRSAFSSARGKEMLLSDHGRFDRRRLEAVRDAYRDLATRFTGQ